MQTPVTRQELYELIWAKPLQQIAPQFGVSDVRLGKVCRAAEIPVPGRGYWAKHRANLAPPRPPLPDSDKVGPMPLRRRTDTDATPQLVGPEVHAYGSNNTPSAVEPLPVEPVFPNDRRARIRRFRELVREVPLDPVGRKRHSEVTRIAAEERARESTTPAPFRASGMHLNTQDGRRRLRIVSTLLGILERMGATPQINDRWARHLQTTVEGSIVFFEIDRPNPYRTLTYEQTAKMLVIKLKDFTGRGASKRIWSDSDGPVEDRLTEVVVAILVAGETNRRDRVVDEHRKRAIQRQQQIWESERRRARDESDAVEKLRSDALAFRQASDIRQLVEAARASTTPPRMVVDDWCAWALKQADSLDPVLNGKIFARTDRRLDPWDLLSGR